MKINKLLPTLIAFFTILLASQIHAQGSVSESAVGTKNRFYCKINSLGFAQLFRRSGNVQLGINRRIRVWERNRNNLRLQARTTAQRFNVIARIRELNRLITDAKDCRSANNPAAACSIFVDSSNNLPAVLPIINGAQCNGTDSPVVALEIYDSSDEVIGGCTGTVVHDNYIITAAHCMESPATSVTIFNINLEVLGSANNFFIHPSYTGSASHDLAVIETSFDIDTSKMPVLTTNNIAANEISAIAGYGQDQSGLSGRFRAGFFSIRNYPGNVIESRFLIGSGSNSCYGDSGGPALVFRSGHWRLAGVVSNGDNGTCGVNGLPDLSRWTNITSPDNLNFLQSVAAPIFAP